MPRRERVRWPSDDVRSTRARAILAAAEDVRATRSTVQGYGLGFKHSTEDGYGRRRRPCVKFFVRRKRDAPSDRESIPEWLTYRWKGRARRIATDVEELRRSVLQANASCQLATYDGETWRIDDALGSCGFFVRAKEDAGRCWVVTAAHVLRRQDRAHPLCSDAGVVDGWRVGPIECDAHVAPSPSSWHYDLGVARVDAALAQLRSHPQSELERVADLGRLIDAYNAGKKIEFLLHSFRRVVRVALDAISQQPIELAPIGQAPRTYGPTLLRTRMLAEGPPLCPGDSGAPLTSLDGKQLVGIHFMGSGDVVGAPSSRCRSAGIALYAGTIGRLIEANLRVPVELARS